jgi:hypothetical protein
MANELSLDTYNSDLIFEAYGAPSCSFCEPLVLNVINGPQRSVFGQTAVSAYATLPSVQRLIALDYVDGGLIDPLDGQRQSRFGLEGQDLLATFRGQWTLDEQLDLMEAYRLKFESCCSHSMRARMRIERLYA